MKPLGLYIHWPFCESKCPYCDFNSHVRISIDEEQWEKSLLEELKSYKDLAKNHTVKSIFFGGGTPSLMPAKTVEALINCVHEHFRTDADMEISLEANPNSIEVQKFKDFRQAGVNRVSVGVQSLDDNELKFLGRLHNADEARNALKIASSTFDNFSFDLIYARPNQTVEIWTDELREALSYQSPHMSLYQLTIEPNTAFSTRYKRGDFKLPDEETSADLYETTAKITNEFGLKQYEVSNYAKPGLESKHNTIYWEYDDYIGIGPGAHGRMTIEGQKTALKNYKVPETWLGHVTEEGEGIQENLPLEKKQVIDECLLMGLRLNKGFPEKRLRDLAGVSFKDVLDLDQVQWLSDQGFLTLQDGHLTVMPKGQICLNTVLKEIIR